MKLIYRMDDTSNCVNRNIIKKNRSQLDTGVVEETVCTTGRVTVAVGGEIGNMLLVTVEAGGGTCATELGGAGLGIELGTPD